LQFVALSTNRNYKPAAGIQGVTSVRPLMKALNVF